MAGIDATVVLGLAGKMAEVFADEGTYRSFPLAPLGLKAESLRAMITEPLGAGATAHAQFALLVNELPDGPLWQPDGQRWLWDVYGDVLRTAILKESPLSPEQQRRYDDAFAVLYVAGPDDVPGPTPAVVAYERYRDAFLAASMEYNNRKGEAEISADTAVKEAWARDEPSVKATLDKAALSWTTLGHRLAVEAARRALNDLSSNSPQAVWSGFLKLYDPSLPEIFLRTSLDGMLYAPTTYVPTDVADVPWPSITVTADDLRAYADKAPAELKERLGGSDDAGVERVTFEYSYVTVNRSWFTPQLFNSQAWRFPDPGHVLSDGGSPPKGECTAYVTGLVLARNITVQRSVPADTPDEPAIDLAFMPAQLSKLTVQARVFGETPVTGATAMVVLDDPTVWKALAVATTPHIATAAPAVRRLDALSAGRMRVVGIPSIRTPIVGLPPPIEPAPPPPQSETSTTDPTDVFVLALQCRLLPKSPYEQGAPSDASEVYIVQRGDTLAKIAGRVYGDKDKWKALYEANRDVIGPDPALIRPGQRLQVP